MRAKRLFKELEVTVRVIDAGTDASHKHFFYQIIYVLEGNGAHIINENAYKFKAGDIFLLTPHDTHSYTFALAPVFCIIDFTKIFFVKQAGSKEQKMDVSEIFKQLEIIFQNQHQIEGILLDNEDKTLFEALIKQLIFEKTTERTFGNIITQNIIFLLLNLIARNIRQRTNYLLTDTSPNLKIEEVIEFMQLQIFNKEHLSIQKISAHFSISSGHLSRLFKEHTGRTIKNFITSYKLEIIQTKLKFSDLTISEIAYQMNFTDESHLNKVFKNAMGLTAKQFRQQYELLKI